MLMFNFHMVFSWALIALAAGAAILIWSKVHENVGVTLPKIIGYIVIIAALLNALCSGYYAVKYWMDGYFDKPFPPVMMQDNKMMMHAQMMQMMQNMKRPMMSGQMMGGKDMQVQQDKMVSSPMMQRQMVGNKMMNDNKMMEDRNMQQPQPVQSMSVNTNQMTKDHATVAIQKTMPNNNGSFEHEGHHK